MREVTMCQNHTRWGLSFKGKHLALMFSRDILQISHTLRRLGLIKKLTHSRSTPFKNPQYTENKTSTQTTVQKHVNTSPRLPHTAARSARCSWAEMLKDSALSWGTAQMRCPDSCCCWNYVLSSVSGVCSSLCVAWYKCNLRLLNFREEVLESLPWFCKCYFSALIRQALLLLQQQT